MPAEVGLVLASLESICRASSSRPCSTKTVTWEGILQPFFQFVDGVPGFAFQCLFQNRVGSSFPIRKTQTPRFTANRNTSDPFLLAGARDTQTEGLQALPFLNWHESDAVFCGVHKSHSSSLACPYLFLLLPLKRTRYFPFLLSFLLALFKSVLIL